MTSSPSEPVAISRLPPSDDDRYAILPTTAPAPSHSITSTVLDFAYNAIESAALRDGIKLIVLGGALEAARRGVGLIAQGVFERESSSGGGTLRSIRSSSSYDLLQPAFDLIPPAFTLILPE